MKIKTILIVAAALLFTVPARALPPSTGPVGSTAVEASNVLLSNKGMLMSLTVTDTAAEYILIINSTTLPADGAVELLYPPIKVSANTTTMIAFPQPLYATKGIVVCNSSTGTFTKTIGAATCIFKGQVQAQ